MNAEQLLFQFHRVADAPDAIPRLRRFILDLAVRGKLVSQDPSDEPTSGLLKRVEAQKARRVIEGRVRKQDSVRSVGIERQLFQLPATWEWVRLGEIAEFSAGRTPSRHDLSYWNTGDHAWVSIADMNDGGVVINTKETVSEKAKTQVFRSEPSVAGTMIMSFKLTIGKISRLGIPAYHNEAIVSIHSHLRELDDYLFKVLPPFADQGDTKDAIKGRTLNRDSISGLRLPLPPLAEQRRIVDKVDELMALCDRLEGAQTERETRRDSLAAASLNRLKEPDHTTFREHAVFHVDHLSRLTTRPDQIPAVRQTILDLAVRGRLVGQDPSDEPAAELIRRIRAEKSQELNQGEGKPKMLTSLAGEAEQRVQLRSGWVWTHVQELCTSVTDGDHLPPPKTTEGVPFLVIGNVRSGSLDFTGCRYVSQDYYDHLDPIRQPRMGDVLYTLVGSFGIPLVIKSDRPFCVQRHIGILRPAAGVDVGFLCRVLESPLVFDQAAACATGIAQKTVPLSGLRRISVPLPPVAEQHRVVAKVDELMALCDRLEGQLTAARTESRRLLEALLREALAPAA